MRVTTQSMGHEPALQYNGDQRSGWGALPGSGTALMGRTYFRIDTPRKPGPRRHCQREGP